MENGGKKESERRESKIRERCGEGGKERRCVEKAEEDVSGRREGR